MNSIVFILLMNSSAWAHEIRPGYLRVTEIDDQEYLLYWKVPLIQGKYIDINPKFDNQVNSELISKIDKGDALIREYNISTKSSIKGKSLRIENLDKTLIDVLMEVQFKDGTQYTTMLQPSKPKYLIPVEFSFQEVIKTYFKLGVEHIIWGYDHLLFVLGLFMLIPGISMLIKTITSFTLAHSLTLILASLGFISLPSSPVEAVIAISIVLLAIEVLRKNQNQRSLTISYPWLVAFIFGLIHGLGFAGALSEIGLPQKSVIPALIIFNIGVEIGQIFFIFLLSIMFYFLKRWNTIIYKYSYLALCYLLGTFGMFWTIDRILNF